MISGGGLFTDDLGEHHVRNVGAEGSNPFISTRDSKDLPHRQVFPYEGTGCPMSLLPNSRISRRLISVLAAIALILATLSCTTGCTEPQCTEPQDSAPGGTLVTTDASERFAPDAKSSASSTSPDGLPAYEGIPYAELHDGVPSFSLADAERGPFQEYAELDHLGRCGAAYALVSVETMPEGERGSIGHVLPTGFEQKRYDIVEGGSLYNRCHLMAFQLTGQNDNIQNLITGTRYMNATGMKPFEDNIASYVKRTGGSVLYRVTPLFLGNELVARGVQMEAFSIEDDGDAIRFNVYCHNVQPGIGIDYATGASWLTDEQTHSAPAASEEAAAESDAAASDEATTSPLATYILNTNTKRFHLPDCSSAASIKEKNRQQCEDSREHLISLGYAPCGACHP